MVKMIMRYLFSFDQSVVFRVFLSLRVQYMPSLTGFKVDHDFCAVVCFSAANLMRMFLRFHIQAMWCQRTWMRQLPQSRPSAPFSSWIGAPLASSAASTISHLLRWVCLFSMFSYLFSIFIGKCASLGISRGKSFPSFVSETLNDYPVDWLSDVLAFWFAETKQEFPGAKQSRSWRWMWAHCQVRLL